MYYIKIENDQPTGYPLSESTIRELLSNISLPAVIDTAELLTLGFAIFQPVLPPEVGDFQRAVEVAPTFDGTTVTQVYEVREMSDQEKAAVSSQVLEASKSKQKMLLTQSDWTELPSVQSKRSAEWIAAWAEYRTLLRDVDKQETWPFISEWPAEPSFPLDIPAEPN